MAAITYPTQQAIALADVAPLSEAKAAAAGSMNMAPRADHQHPRLTSAQIATLDNMGTQTVTFTRTFDTEPAISIIAVENDTKSPPDFKVKTFAVDANGKYTGCTVYATRARPLPALNAITDLLGGVVGKLTGFMPNEPAAGVRFSIIALHAS